MTDIVRIKGDQIDRFLTEPEPFLHELQDLGPFVHITLAGVETLVLHDLDVIHQVLADKLEHVDMVPAFARLSHVTGTGILTNYNWDTWHPRRRVIVQPLGARAVRQFHDRMLAVINDELDQWTLGTHPDLTATVRTLTLRVVADLLFTTDLTDEAMEIIDRATNEIHKWAEDDPANQNLDDEPASFRAGIDELDRFIRSVLATRSPENPGDDMVGWLITASQDPDMPLDAEGVRDEAITLMLAGHETVTNTITFALALIGRHPDKANATARSIVDETLRIYPPVHITGRLITKEFDVGSVVIPAGWEVLIPEFVLYRNDDHFERADEFLPERWEPESTFRLERRAYFPFLTGPKFCVGSHFALLEATEAIDAFRRRFTLEILDPEPPQGRFFALSYGPDRPMPYRLENV